MDGKKICSAALAGKWTFPFAVLLFVLLRCLFYFFSVSEEQPLQTLSASAGCLFAALCMNRLNSSFSVIRERTDAPGALFLLFTSVCLSLHPLPALYWAATLMLLGIYNLFACYEAENPVPPIFRAALFWGTACIFFPPLSLLTPVLLWGVARTTHMRRRQWRALLIGLLTPLWFAVGYHLLVGDYGQMAAFFGRFVPNDPPRLAAGLTLQQLLLVAVLLLFYVMSLLNIVRHSFFDKVQTRLQLNFFAVMQLFLLLYALLQPALFHHIAVLQIACQSFLTVHWLLLHPGRVTTVFFFIGLLFACALLFLSVWSSSWIFA